MASKRRGAVVTKRELTPEEQEELADLAELSNRRELNAGERRRYCELHGFHPDDIEYIAAHGWSRE